MGDLLTRWTIRAALLCYVAVLAGYLIADRPQATQRRTSRWLWTIGCACYWLHMAAAFAYFHQWSHARALAATARQTQQLLGVAVGAGLYFNYLFAAVWTADVIAWWFLGERYFARPRWLSWLVHGYLFFIAFNGAVVFARGGMFWAGVAATALLAILVMRRFLLRIAVHRKDLAP